MSDPTSHQGWNELANHLERLVADYETARPGFETTTAGAVVDAVKMVIRLIREEFPGH